MLRVNDLLLLADAVAVVPAADVVAVLLFPKEDGTKKISRSFFRLPTFRAFTSSPSSLLRLRR